MLRSNQTAATETLDYLGLIKMHTHINRQCANFDFLDLLFNCIIIGLVGMKGFLSPFLTGPAFLLYRDGSPRLSIIGFIIH